MDYKNNGKINFNKKLEDIDNKKRKVKAKEIFNDYKGDKNKIIGVTSRPIKKNKKQLKNDKSIIGKISKNLE